MTTIWWCMVTEIWSATDRIFCHSGPFYPFTTYGPRKLKLWKNEKSTWRKYHLTNVYHKWQSYDVWLLRYGVQRTEFFVILDHFLPFYYLNNPKNQNFEKMKKAPGDIITLHMCAINNNHMMYGSWDIERDGQISLSLWTIFCPFAPLITQKIKILKKWKNHLEILSFYTSAPKFMIICYTVPQIWCVTDVIVIFHFGLFYALLPFFALLLT